MAFLDTLTEPERRIVHGALLGQVDDNHAGSLMGWTEPDYEVASRLYGRIDLLGADAESRVVALSLLYPLYDIDHPTLSDVEADLAEAMLSALAKEYGR